MIVSFVVQKVFSFTRSHLLIVDLSAYTNSVVFRKSSPVPMISRLFLTFSSFRYSIIWFYVVVFDPFGVKLCAGGNKY